MIVVFEGHDGVGKSSVLQGVRMRLESEGCRVATVRNPDPKLKDLRESVDGSGDLETSFRYYLACSLYSAAMADIALLSGVQVVLMDRSFYSTIVSHEARGLMIQEGIARLFPRIDLGFWVTATELTRQGRLRQRAVSEAHDRGSFGEELIRLADEAYDRLGLIRIDNNGFLQIAVEEVMLRIHERRRCGGDYEEASLQSL